MSIPNLNRENFKDFCEPIVNHFFNSEYEYFYIIKFLENLKNYKKQNPLNNPFVLGL